MKKIPVLFLSEQSLQVGYDIEMVIGGIKSLFHIQHMAELGQEMYKNSGYVFVSGYKKDTGPEGTHYKGFLYSEYGKGIFVEGSFHIEPSMMEIIRSMIFESSRSATA